MSFDAFESINYPYVGEISSLGLRVFEKNLVEKKGIFKPQTAYSDKQRFKHRILRTLIRNQLKCAHQISRNTCEINK